MIENMRKYTVLMAVVFVLLGAGFLFTMNNGTSSRGGGGSGTTQLEVYNRALDQQEYRRMGVNTLELASEAGLSTYINFLMVPDMRQMQQAFRFGFNYYQIMGRNLTRQDYNRFVANRIILQHAMLEMGIYASEEEVTEAIKTSQRFAPTGKYDASIYTTFVEKRLGKLGMTEKDLREIVRENLCLNKLISIVGGGLISPRSGISDLLDAQGQTITLARIVFNRDDYVEKENPTEEEIKTYWEAHQDAYKTEEQRRINYFLVTIPKDAEEKKETTPAPTPLALNATEEEKAARAAADALKKTTDDAAKAAKAEKRDLATKALKREINEISQEIYDRISEKKPLEFEALLTEHKHALVNTALFTQAKMPKELAGLTIRGAANQGRTLAQHIFAVSQSDDSYDLISDPLPVGDDGYIIFTLEETVTPELLDFATARDKARAQLIGENGTKKVQAAAKEARDAIVVLMKSGKDFDAAAKEKGLVPVQVGPYSLGGIAPKNEPSHRQLHQTASGLNPGDVSEPIDENDRSLFIYVDKREIEDTEDNKNRIDATIDNAKQQLMLLTFLNWINHQYLKAEVKSPASEQQ